MNLDVFLIIFVVVVVVVAFFFLSALIVISYIVFSIFSETETENRNKQRRFSIRRKR